MKAVKILGLQKLTLLDYPGKTACTVFTGGCNFRCPYCHNASVVFEIEHAVSHDELFAFLKKRRNILDGVCITGGEPLINDDIEFLIKEIRDLGYLIKLDTNGYFPEKLEYLIGRQYIDYAAMDIKNSLPRYAQTVGVTLDTDKIKESAKILMSGNTEYEFRTTAVRELHDENSFEEIGQWLNGAKRYFLQGFVDSGNLIGSGMSGFTEAEMSNFKEIVSKYITDTELRGI